MDQAGFSHLFSNKDTQKDAQTHGNIIPENPVISIHNSLFSNAFSAILANNR